MRLLFLLLLLLLLLLQVRAAARHVLSQHALRDSLQMAHPQSRC
jgi:hypothetical protein